MTRSEGIAAAKDLTAGEPHPLDCELDGYAWVPRMLDKARATLAGTAGTFMFGCPVDHTCMARLGVPPELVLDLAARHADDRRVLADLQAHGIPSASDAWFDGVAVEDELQLEDIYLRVRRRDELPSAAGGRLFAGADHGAGVSVVLIEAGPGEAEAPHTHPIEEVVVIQDGQATFFLGAHQARIVRAGEVVRIPAGVEHRYENRGGEPLRAVAVQGAAEVVTTHSRSSPNRRIRSGSW
jgi:quercetin dioxygenase-like cupin family protein